jgi:tight adherence protein C
MTMWILSGVLVIALTAIIIRFAFGRSGKRRGPVMFDSPISKNGHNATVKNAAGTPHEPVAIDVPAVDGTTVAPNRKTSVSMPSAAQNHVADRIKNDTRLGESSHSIFSEFQGITDADCSLNAPDPEELPIDADDLVFGVATLPLAEMLPESAARKVKQRQHLSAAGYHSRGSWLSLNAIRFVLAFLGLALVGLGLIIGPPAAEPYLLATVIAAPLMGWAIPPLLVSSKATERRADIERGLPDALDMLNMGVSQGLTVQSSLKRIGPEISPAHPALAQELQIVNQQAHIGSLNQALSNFAKRLDSPEVSSFTSLLIQSETTGTSISRALSDYSDSMRSTIRERADSRANAASFKLLFPTVLCLMPSVFMFLLGPAVVSLSDFANNTANELIDSRENAVNSLDTTPQFTPPDQ